MFTKRTSTKRRTPLESYNKVWLGAIGLAIIGVLIAAVVLISALDIGKRAYSAHFAQAAQIASGNKVTVAGIQVGEVTGVKLAGDHVVVRFSVDKNLTLDDDTRAAIKEFETVHRLPVTGEISDRFLHELAAVSERPVE